MRKGFSLNLLILCGIFAASSLLSCSPFTAPDRSITHKITPDTFSLGAAASTPEQKWWRIFSSPELNSLVDEALAENLSLRAYWARLDKARFLAVKAGSTLYPSVSGDASAAYSRNHFEGGSIAGSSESKVFSLGLAASYELDLWGRVQAVAESADLAVRATREDLNSAAMTVTAEVARRWIGNIARKQEAQLLQQQLETNQTYLELVELRFRKSLASALDVMQQKQLVERVKAQIPLVEMQEELLRNELAVLTGKMPHEFSGTAGQTLPDLSSVPAGGVPAHLLENRPDIQAAYNRLAAADQDLVVARADRLPAIRLTGSAAYNSDELDRLFDNWLLNLAASLTAPLLDGGRRKAEVGVAKAAVEEHLALYHQTVLTAVQEVEESLVREKRIREHISRTEQQLLAAKAALSEARSRYMNGLNDYLPVLTQLLSVQNLEMDLVSRKEDLFGARISLHRAIGGTWTGELTQPGGSEPIQQDEQS